jgi:translocation and assembly module TamB
MKKAVSVLKKTLRVVLYVVLSFVLLFIVIAILIQIPAIQTKIVHYATSFVSDKTHTKVELKKISISFPKSLVIEGLYLEDTKKDTLLYAGKLKVNIAFSDLFNKKIHVRSFALEEVTVNLKRAETDSLFNFNFLATAFSDPAKPKKVEPKTKSKWTFSADNVRMKEVRFRFDDEYGGTDVAAHVKQLQLKMDKIDIGNLVFNVDELSLENSSASVRIKQSIKPKVTNENPKKVSVKVTANKILINNTIFYFGDSKNNQSLDVNINTLSVTKPDFDLLGESVKVDHLSLSESKAQFNRTDNSAFDTATVVKSTTQRKSDWKVSANSIDMKDNALAYIVVNKPKLKNTFDVNNLVYEHVTLAATALYYSYAELKASISKLTAVDQNDFSITHFETDFRMDQQSITAKNLKALTTNSAIDAGA